jgi:hypothetical protein
MGNLQFGSHILQFAVPVGHAYGTGVVAFGMQQFGGNFLVLPYALVGSGNGHVGAYFCAAGGHQFVVAGYFHKAKPAGTYIGEAIHVAHGENFNIVLPAYFQYGLIGSGLYGCTVNGYFNVVHTIMFKPQRHVCFVPFCLAKKVPKKAPRRLKPPSGGKSPDLAFVLL